MPDEYNDITIVRTGATPLKFKGKELGSGSTRSHSGPNQNRWTTVDIYLTKGGKFIAHVTNHTCWEGEHDYTKAQAFDSASEVIDWLKNDEGDLGRASQEALERAAKAHAAFADAYCETVD